MIEKLAIDFPEVRAHLDHLRRDHAKMLGMPPPSLPRRTLPAEPKRRAKKIRTTLRLSPEVVEEFKAAGPGWQTRLDEELLRLVMEKERTGTAG